MPMGGGGGGDHFGCVQVEMGHRGRGYKMLFVDGPKTSLLRNQGRGTIDSK